MGVDEGLDVRLDYRDWHALHLGLDYRDGHTLDVSLNDRDRHALNMSLDNRDGYALDFGLRVDDGDRNALHLSVDNCHRHAVNRCFGVNHRDRHTLHLCLDDLLSLCYMHRLFDRCRHRDGNVYRHANMYRLGYMDCLWLAGNRDVNSLGRTRHCDVYCLLDCCWNGNVYCMDERLGDGCRALLDGCRVSGRGGSCCRRVGLGQGGQGQPDGRCRPGEQHVVLTNKARWVKNKLVVKGVGVVAAYVAVAVERPSRQVKTIEIKSVLRLAQRNSRYQSLLND